MSLKIMREGSAKKSVCFKIFFPSDFVDCPGVRTIALDSFQIAPTRSPSILVRGRNSPCCWVNDLVRYPRL